jgi:ribose transport system ATP-binding protein
MVAIARGVSFNAKVVVLDEPTSSLTEHEVQILYDVIRRLKAEGTAVVYISHRFDELYTVCDRVTILRDGKFVATRPLAGLEKIDLVCLMLGKERDELRRGTTAFKHTEAGRDETPLLSAENLKRGRKLNDVTVEVARGEIVGLAGLLGSGRTETARAIFGADQIEEGEVRLEGKAIKRGSVNDAIDAGIAFLTEDRKAEGIIPELSVRENLTLAALPALSQMGIVSRARQTEIVDKFMRRLGIKAASAEQKIRELSGGNQQKGAAGALALQEPEIPHSRRADARHRHRREGRNSGACGRTRGEWPRRPDDLFGVGGTGRRQFARRRDERRAACGRTARRADYAEQHHPRDGRRQRDC